MQQSGSWQHLPWFSLVLNSAAPWRKPMAGHRGPVNYRHAHVAPLAHQPYEHAWQCWLQDTLCLTTTSSQNERHGWDQNSVHYANYT